MDLVELLFRATGATCLLGGYLRARTLLFSAIADRAVAAFADHGEPQTPVAYLVPSVGAVIVASSGVALSLMSFWALPLFMAGLVINTGWFVWAQYSSPPRNSAEEDEGIRAANATLVYAALALGVVWLWREGRLGGPGEPVPLGLVVATAFCLAGWLIHNLAMQPNADEVFHDPALRPVKGELPVRVRLDPQVGLWPLVDVERNRRINHLVWLPEDLAVWIDDWNDIFQRAHRDGHADPWALVEAANYHSFLDEGRSIALALCEHFGANNVEMSPIFEGSPEPS